MKYFRLVIETNITLALASVFLAAASALQFGVKPDFAAYLVLIFSGTFVAYNIHHVYSHFRHRNFSVHNYAGWVYQHKLFFYVVMIIAALGVLWSWLLIDKAVQLAILVIVMVSLLYALPAFRFKSKRFGLRDIPLLKTFLIVTVWSIATVLLPAIQLGVSLNDSIQLVFLERMVFLFSLAIMFDIRDMESDARTKLVTIPRMIGKYNSFLLASALMVLFLATCMYHYSDSLSFVFTALVISAISTLGFIVYTMTKTKAYFHYRVFDGTLLFQPILIFICYYLFSAF